VLSQLGIVGRERLVEQRARPLTHERERAKLGATNLVVRFRLERGQQGGPRVLVLNLAECPCYGESHVVVAIAERGNKERRRPR
jgi:hypothetical protein